MGRDRDRSAHESAEAISIVGPGMTFVGNCETEGTLRVEGRFEGSIRAGRTVVIGPDGIVTGDVRARDATVAGTIKGTLIAESKLDLQETCRLDGEVYARTVRVGEGAVVNAAVHMGEDAVGKVTGGDMAKGPKLHAQELAATASA
ncbi:MAG: polymer-forming cytoskeletal protein [Gemmatimonadota bacterium]